jgi:ectoine hydroxylase-related dioxygenase (phytanoyl-CoA dioxygenase family)
MDTTSLPTKVTVPRSSGAPEVRLAGTATPDQVVRCIREFGYVIVDELALDTTRAAQRELAPYFERAPAGTGSFTGERTQRVARLVARSAACRELVLHPLVLETVQRLFDGQCYHPQLALTQAIRVHPGAAAQGLHRDDNVFPFLHPRPPSVVFGMWALSEFDAENGATRVIPGSHQWGDDAAPDEGQSIAAKMSPGSLLLWEGATFHGAGANQTNRVRSGALIGYNLGWLRQYENQYLAVPPELARSLSPQMQELLGYKNHGYLGTYEGVDARELLVKPGVELPAPVDHFTPELAGKRRERH